MIAIEFIHRRFGLLCWLTVGKQLDDFLIFLFRHVDVPCVGVILGHPHYGFGLAGDDIVVGLLHQRRVLQRDGAFRALPLIDVMTRNPRTIGPDHLAVAAVELMERYRINQMLVVDENAILIGALNMHDLFSKKVI